MIDEFHRDGFVVARNVFSAAEAAALKNEARRVVAPEPGDRPAADAKAREDFRRHGVFLGLAANSPLFRDAARHPEIVAALRRILGPHVVFLNDKLVRKSADTDFGSPWHQDYPYWKGSHKLSVWIALDAATAGNGCLKVIPGSHRVGVLDHGGDANDGHGFNNRLTSDLVNEEEAVPVEVEAGSAIIFGDLLFHASYPNTSGKDRWALISTYKNGSEPDPPYDWASAAFAVCTPG